MIQKRDAHLRKVLLPRLFPPSDVDPGCCSSEFDLPSTLPRDFSYVWMSSWRKRHGQHSARSVVDDTWTAHTQYILSTIQGPNKQSYGT